MLIKQYLKKMLPNAEQIANESKLSWLNHYLRNPLLWHINRRSIAKGTAIGLLMAFMPLPMQMLIAAILAILFRANLPISIGLTWITNPVTFVPLNYFIYKVGGLLVSNGNYPSVMNFEFKGKSWHEIATQFVQWLHSVGKPFLVGLPIVAIGSSILGYCGVQLMWRLSIYYRRKKKRLGL